jgi:hypothetical protein
LKSLFMHTLERQGSLSALLTHSTIGIQVRRAPRSDRRVGVQKWIAFLPGRLPRFQNTTMNAANESSRRRRGTHRSPAEDPSRRTRPLPHQHQQTITNYCFLCVIACVTLTIFKASESSRSFINGGGERVKGIEARLITPLGDRSRSLRDKDG